MPAEWMPRWRGRSSTSRRQLGHQRGDPLTATVDGCSDRLRRSRPPVDPVDPRRPPVHLLGGEPEGLPHVAHGRAGTVGDDVGHLRRVTTAVPLVDVLDDFLAPARFDVDIDVRRSVPGRGQEALEEEAEIDRVDVGHPEGVTDGRVGGRAPALAVDVELTADPGDVPDNEEVAGEPQPADDLELVFDLGPGPRHPLVVRRAVALERPLGHQLAQVALLVHPLGYREVGEAGGHQAQIEGTAQAQLARPLDHPGPAGEATELLARPP